MALQRNESVVVTSEAIEAEYDDIIGFQVDLLNKSISISIGSGNMVDDKLDVKTIKNYIIQDTPETMAYKEETLNIVDNKINLEIAPEGDQITLFVQNPLDYTVNEKEVTFIEEQLDGLSEIKVGYSFKKEAMPVFSLMASQTADGDKSIYLNLKQLLWAKLIELGHVSGTIV
jgi:hypothetical protein